MSKDKFVKLITAIFLMTLLLTSCGKVTKVNPNEPPYNLQLTKIHQNRVELSWEYTSSKQDTFQFFVYRLDPYMDFEQWQTIAILDKDIYVYQDNINTSDTLVYAYKVAVYKTEEDQFTEDSEIVAYFSEYADPSNLEVTQISDTKLEITWKDNSIGEDGFTIEKKVNGGDWFVLTHAANSPYIDDVNLFDNIEYKVYAYKGITKSKSLEYEIQSTLMAPDSLQLDKYEDSKIRLNWNDNSNGEDNFVIEKKVGSLDWAECATVDSNVTQYIDDNQLIGASIYYRVKAIKNNYSSGYTNEASINILLDQIGAIHTPGNAVDLSVQSHNFGVMAYVADMYSGFTLIDCSHPNDLEAKTYNEGLTDRIFSVDSKNNICYFTIHDDPQYHSGFGMLDLTDINQQGIAGIDTLFIIGYTELPNVPYDIATLGSYSYAASGESGISVIISQGPPHLITTVSTNGDARKCVIDNNTLYVANGLNGGLAILDISNPMNPTLLSNLPLTGYAKDIFAENGYVYLANAEGGFVIVDANDPANPMVKATIVTGGFVSSVTKKGDFAYVTDWDNGFYIINLENLDNPYIQGLLEMESQPRAIQVEGSYAYILDNQGLKIIQIKE